MTQRMYWPEKYFQHFWRRPIMSVFFFFVIFILIPIYLLVSEHCASIVKTHTTKTQE